MTGYPRTPGVLASSDITGPIVDWLTSEPCSDLREELLALTTHLETLGGPQVSAAQFHRCVELFYGRALQLAVDLRRDLRSHALPLPAEQAAAARQMTSALMRLAQGLERVVTEGQQGTIRPRQQVAETVATRALRLLVEHFLINYEAGLEPPADFWSVAYRLYMLSRVDAASPGGTEPALFVYKILLALASLEAHSLTAIELDWTSDYLSRAAGHLLVQEERPSANTNSAWYWLDAAGSAEPVPWTRKEAPTEGQFLFFSTTPLARRAGQALSRHENGQFSELQPTSLFPGVQPAALLGRLRERWLSPAKRIQPRRTQRYTVQACVGLPAIWRLLRGDKSQAASLVSTWDVQNESPGGYAIMHVTGLAAGITAGSAVALRDDSDEMWQLCVVRWLRSDSPTEIELGLQIVSRGAVPVRIAFRGSGKTRELVEALVLPVLPALRQHQAILAPAGSYTSRRFTLVSDVDRLYVAQARLLSLDMQTANVELFQYEIDPYPL